MRWNKELLEEISIEKVEHLEEKKRVAEKIAEKVANNQIIGFGSGSTSYLATIAIADKVKKENLQIIAIPTSFEIKMLCAYLEIPTASLSEYKPDWSFDGADEVDSNHWLIKGKGGALFKEKLNIANSPITHILIDKSKKVSCLGEKCKIPVEIYPDAISYIKEELVKLGVEEIVLRQAVNKAGPVITENGNLILDVKFKTITENLERNIKTIPGVIESGLFIGYNIEIVE